MRKLLIVLLVFISSLVAGCSFNKGEEDYLALGKEQLEKHEYAEAMKNFSIILEDDKNNDTAKAMYLQAMRMSNALDYEAKEDYESAIRELDFIAQIKNGSSTIKSEAAKRKDTLKKSLNDEERAREERKEKAKDSASGEVERVESEARRHATTTKKKESVNKYIQDDEDEDEGGGQSSKPSQSQPQQPTQPSTDGGANTQSGEKTN
ncbi:MAG: hypothetical protein LBN09_00485 [Clostridioides sp.]|jgi:hypothetical protein|nr:hypothetical protein [Clostridioides sp.]